MARIRSIHPGFFTDEELVTVTMAARLLILGLGVEADDKGVFEWKPLTIKMKVFPADNVDIDVLLAELGNANAIRKYENGGRIYGAIRNFRKHQRPKTPNDVHPADADIRNYVGLSYAISETLPRSSGKTSEIPPQMEEGGDKMEEEKESKEGTRKRVRADPYAFSGRVIRLDQADFDTWLRTFNSIPDLTAELSALDSWLAAQPAEKQAKWFHTTSGALNRKHQEILKADRDAPKQSEYGPC